MVGADRSDNFEYLVERVLALISGWKEKMLSIGGKEALIKAVAQAIAVFAMTVFNILKKMCKGITDAILQFWWGDYDDHKKMQWLAWLKMFIPKDIGGMGFRDLHTFNTVMLAKQCWRLLEDLNSLCARVLRACYYPNGNLLKAKLKSGSSFTWQSVLYGIQNFNRGCIWRVGEGDQINMWNDP
jgi:hypothetical protein